MKSNSLHHSLFSTFVLFLFSSFAAGQSFQQTIHHAPPAPDVVAADVNQDRKIDLLTPQTDEEGEGLIFLNHVDGTFSVDGSQTISNVGFPATRVGAFLTAVGITERIQ